MDKYTVIYNPFAGNGRGKEEAEKLKDMLKEAETEFLSMTDIPDYDVFFAELPENSKLVVCGGDGTLNRFANETAGKKLPEEIYYFATGSGNDFLHDLGYEKGHEPINIAKHLNNLPTVTVNGRNSLFLNGIGYGIDGYCCEVGDKQRETSDKPVNYASIAIKGLLFHYKPTNAVITVDGVRHEYKKVWLAPTMNGRFYGGGMMPTPNRDRLAADRKVSTMVFHGSGKLKTLIIFPSLFKGEHVKHTKYVEVLDGKDITVEFDRPTALQIDGETVLGVTKCEMKVDN